MLYTVENNEPRTTKARSSEDDVNFIKLKHVFLHGLFYLQHVLTNVLDHRFSSRQHLFLQPLYRGKGVKKKVRSGRSESPSRAPKNEPCGTSSGDMNA